MLEKHTLDITGHFDDRCLHCVKAAREEHTRGVRMSLVKKPSTLIPTVARDCHTEVYNRWDTSECDTNLDKVQYRVKTFCLFIHDRANKSEVAHKNQIDKMKEKTRLRPKASR